ncbi:hypothetical protein EDB85DRAFT_2298648 [Lactarius pseudohatsudake]|nr:hypothetical protein EDB85DRAFT_2298648 [Lactarius pseudohatsudake]
MSIVSSATCSSDMRERGVPSTVWNQRIARTERRVACQRAKPRQGTAAEGAPREPGDRSPDRADRDRSPRLADLSIVPAPACASASSLPRLPDCASASSLAQHADDHIAAAAAAAIVVPCATHRRAQTRSPPPAAPPRTTACTRGSSLSRHPGYPPGHRVDQDTGGREGEWKKKKDGAKARVPDPKNTAGGPWEESAELEDKLTGGCPSGGRVRASASSACSLFVLRRRGEEEEMGMEKDEMHDGSGLSGLTSRVLVYGWDYEWDWDLHTSIRAVPRPGPPPLYQHPPTIPPAKSSTKARGGRRFTVQDVPTPPSLPSLHVFTSPSSHHRTDVVALRLSFSPPSSMFTPLPTATLVLARRPLRSSRVPLPALFRHRLVVPGYLDLSQTRVLRVLSRPPVVGVQPLPPPPSCAGREPQTSPRRDQREQSATFRTGLPSGSYCDVADGSSSRTGAGTSEASTMCCPSRGSASHNLIIHTMAFA